MDLRYVGVRYRTNVWREGIQNLSDERSLLSSSPGCQLDLRAGETSLWQWNVHLVTADLPPSADYSTGGILQPRTGAPDLDLLPARQPESVDQTVLEHNAHVLEVLVDQRGAREAQRHPDHFSAF